LPVDFKLYLITDRKQVKMPLAAAVRLALEGAGCSAEGKGSLIRDMLLLAKELRAITNEFGARLFINDRVDVARAVKADGVHLGHQSMPVTAVRKIVGKDMLTHSIEEAKDGVRKADFILLAPYSILLQSPVMGLLWGCLLLVNLKKSLISHFLPLAE
jgi:thiamine-phosphate pyrophosphorylase